MPRHWSVLEYLYFTTELRRLHPPVTGGILLQDMPGCRGPRCQDPELQHKTKSSCVSSQFSGSAYLCLHSFKYAAQAAQWCRPILSSTTQRIISGQSIRWSLKKSIASSTPASESSLPSERIITCPLKAFSSVGREFHFQLNTKLTNVAHLPLQSQSCAPTRVKLATENLPRSINLAFDGLFLRRRIHISQHDEWSAEFEAIYINLDTNLWAPAASVINTTPDPPAPH